MWMLTYKELENSEACLIQKLHWTYSNLFDDSEDSSSSICHCFRISIYMIPWYFYCFLWSILKISPCWCLQKFIKSCPYPWFQHLTIWSLQLNLQFICILFVSLTQKIGRVPLLNLYSRKDSGMKPLNQMKNQGSSALE